TSQVKALQQARLDPTEAAALAILHTSATGGPHNQQPFANPTRSLHHAKAHIFERVSVARDYQLLAEALRHGRGELKLSALKATFAAQESSGRVLRAGNDVGTLTELQRERAMIAAINEGMNRFPALNTHFIPSPELQKSPQRTHAVQFILNSRDS